MSGQTPETRRSITVDDIGILPGDDQKRFAEKLVQYVRKEGVSVIIQFGLGIGPFVQADPSTTKEQVIALIEAGFEIKH